MSEAEMKFLNKYAELRFKYYKDQVFKNLYKNYSDFKEIEVMFSKNPNETREKKVLVQTNRNQ